MKKIKPFLEKITPSFGSSFFVKQYGLSSASPNEPFWHFHPEIELVYIKGGNGKRHVGHHLSYFHNGDLILLGENLPHYGFTDRLTRNETETIVQFTTDFAGASFLSLPETTDIKQLLERAKAGLVFHGATKNAIGQRLETLPQLPPFERLQELLSILQALAQSTEYELLHAAGVALEVAAQNNERIDEVYQFVRDNFQRPITIAEVSALANMTASAFCRYFKKLGGKTFTKFVNEFRIVHACKLLAEQPLSITEVSLESGFNNFSHFSKHFREVTGKSPSQYRKELKQLVS